MLLQSPTLTQSILEAAVQALLSQLDEDPDRPGLRETPERVARMYQEFLSPRRFKFKTFPAEGADQMVLVKDIPFYSLCEHHLLPFFGKAAVAYIPDQKLAGLSKLARTVDFFAHRLQTQERLAEQIADSLDQDLEPKGVAVLLEGTHLCMAMRGVQKAGAVTLTSALRGVFYQEGDARSEFLNLTRKDHD